MTIDEYIEMKEEAEISMRQAIESVIEGYPDLIVSQMDVSVWKWNERVGGPLVHNVVNVSIKTEL